MGDRCQPAPTERRGDADAESERYEKGRHRAGAVGGSAQSGGGHAWESRETIQVRESLACSPRVVIRLQTAQLASEPHNTAATEH